MEPNTGPRSLKRKADEALDTDADVGGRPGSIPSDQTSGKSSSSATQFGIDPPRDSSSSLMSIQGSTVPTQPPTSTALATTTLADASRPGQTQGGHSSAPMHNAGDSAATNLPDQQACGSRDQSSSLITTGVPAENTAEPVVDDADQGIAVFLDSQYSVAGRTQEWSLEQLIKRSMYKKLAPRTTAIYLVVCRWKEEELEHNGRAYLDAEYEDDASRDKIRKLLVTAITPDSSKGRFGFANLRAITITDKYAERALGLAEIETGIRLGAIFRPNTLFNDYEDSLVHEKSFYEASLLRAFIIVYYALEDLAQSATAPSIQRLSVESSIIDKVFRGLPLLRSNLSTSAANRMRQGFASLSELLLEINASQPIKGYGDYDVQDILPDEEHMLPTRGEPFYNILSRCTNLTQLHLVIEGGEKKVRTPLAYQDLLARFVEGPRMMFLGDFNLVGQSMPQQMLVKFIRKHAATLERLELCKMNLRYIEHDDHNAANQAHLGPKSYWYNVLQACLPQPPATHIDFTKRNAVKHSAVQHKGLKYVCMTELMDGNVQLNSWIREIMQELIDDPLSEPGSEEAGNDLEEEELDEAEENSEEEMVGANVLAAINTMSQHIRINGIAADRAYTFMRYETTGVGELRMHHRVSTNDTNVTYFRAVDRTGNASKLQYHHT